MQNIKKKASLKETSNNPQMAQNLNKYQLKQQQVSSEPFLSQQYPNESEIERYFLRALKDHRKEVFKQSEANDQFLSQNSRSSISNDWKTADIIQYSRLKKRQSGEYNELFQLRKTVKTILKSNQDYRMKIIAVQKQKAQAKLQNFVLLKQAQNLEKERQIWLIQKNYTQEIQQLLKSKRQTSKQFYQKRIKILQYEVQKAVNDLEVQKKRNNDLQQYNRKLFQKVTECSQNYKAQQQQINMRENELSNSLKNKENEIQKLNQQKKTYIEKLNKAVQTQKQLMIMLKNRQREAVELRGNINQLQKIVQQQEKDKRSNLQQYTRKIDHLNSKLQGQKELKLSKSIQVARYQQLKNAYQNSKQQNIVLKQKQSLLQQLKLIKNSLQLRLVESELRCDDRERLLNQQQLLRLNLDIQLNRYKKQLSFNYQEILSKHQNELQSQKTHSESRFLRITNDLLLERRKNDEILSNLANLQKQNERLISQQQQLKLQIDSKEAIITQKSKQIDQIKEKIKRYEIICVQNSAKILEKQFVANNLQKILEQNIRKYQQELTQNKNTILKLQSKLSQQKSRYQIQKQSINTLVNEQRQKVQSKNRQINEAQTKIMNLHNQIQHLKKLCNIQKKSIKEKKEQIENEIQGAEKLKNTLIELKRQNYLMELQIKRLQQQNFSLSLKLQKLQLTVEDKKKLIQQKDRNLQQQNQVVQIKFQNLQSQILILRKNNQQLRQRYLKMEKQLTGSISHLQEQLNVYKHKKILENIHNLTSQVLKSQNIIIQLTHPAPNSIKKFVNLMNSAHRQNLSRQIQKIVEYYNKIEQAKSFLHKHYNNMKIIINLIEPNSFTNSSPRNSPQKYEN